MNTLLTIVIFCVVLFLYIHTYSHIKKNNDLELFNIDIPSKNKLEEICNIKQPLTFFYQNDDLLNSCNINYIHNNYHNFDINIRNNNINSSNTLSKTIPLFTTDLSHCYSEYNYEFLNDTGLKKILNQNDMFFRPPLVINRLYDIIFGPGNTPLRFNIHYRNYYYITDDSVQVKLCPPKYTSDLHKIDDYENMEFYSQIDPWNVQDKFKNTFQKIKFIEFTLQKGSILYIPPFWWFSFKFNPNSFIVSFKYKTPLNILATSPQLAMGFLQRQNVKLKVKSNSK